MEIEEKGMKAEQEKLVRQSQQQTDNKSKNPTIGGVGLDSEQWQELQGGGFIYLENMNRSNGSGKFSSYIFLNDEQNKVFFSRESPDDFVKYGKYEMRVRDKIRIENGDIVKVKVKWYGGGYAYPHLWKENKSDAEYKESWGDPSIKREEKQENSQRQIPQNPKKNRGRGM